MSDNNGQSNGQLTPDEWKNIEEQFMKWDGTIKEFVKNKELVYSTVYKHSCTGNWIKKRDDRKRDELLSGKVPFDEKVDKTMDMAMEIICRNLETGIIKGRDLANTVNTVERIQAVKYRMLDIPLPKQRVEDVTDIKAPADEFEERVKEQLQKIQQGVDDE